MQYTRKCKKTIIDLSHDSLLLDVEIPGFDELPEDYFAPESTHGHHHSTNRSKHGLSSFADYKRSLYCTRIVYPWLFPKTEGRKVSKSFAFKIIIVDQLSNFKLTIKIGNLKGVNA